MLKHQDYCLQWFLFNGKILYIFLIISDQGAPSLTPIQKFSDIILKILMQKIEITIVPREVGQLWDQLLQEILSDVCSPPTEVPLLSLTDLIPHTYNQKYNVYHGKCHQQHTSNLCGYHATFNTLCFLNLIRRGHTQYNIMSGASFWMFKKRVEQFLFQIKRKHKLADEWPWKESDILYGDFQRTYNKICLERFEQFQIFRNHDQFELYPFTWEFQYENLIVSQDKKKQLNRLIQYFIQYNSQKPLIISFMLAITNHWMCLNAVKIGNQTQYWFFDSSNKNFLNLSSEEIDALVEQISQQRIAFKNAPLTQFFKKNIGVRFRDTQISLRLIINCLQGKATIDQYSYNQLFNIFANPLSNHWDSDIKMFHQTVKEYWYNITSFLRMPLQHGLFTAQNSRRFYKFIETVRSIKSQSEEGKRLYQMVKKYEIATCL